jgi:hypothetical protein
MVTHSGSDAERETDGCGFAVVLAGDLDLER